VRSRRSELPHAADAFPGRSHRILPETDPETHGDLVECALRHKIPVICQKPLAPDFETAREMVDICSEAKLGLFVRENWRWQRPIREVKKALDSGVIGRPFRARVDFSSSFPVFDNQPFLRELERFILCDMGTHVPDARRDSLCQLCYPCSPFPRGALVEGELVDHAEVASEVGFTDQSYFDRRFKAAFQRTPRDFRPKAPGLR
jgi:AraC-like DNA-binding protein